MTEFRHTIGNELYEYHIPYDSGPEETRAYPIIRRTASYVYTWSGLTRCGQEHLARFSVAELERNGQAYNRPNDLLLSVRPRPNWPLMPAEVRKPEQLAIAGGQP